MDQPNKRGSEKLLDAWKKRMLTEDSVNEIANALAQSPAEVEECVFYGGANPTGAKVTLLYTGDDIPRCGNDISFWLNWHQKYGGITNRPVPFPKGLISPEWLRLVFSFGQTGSSSQPEYSQPLPGETGGNG